MTRTARRLLVAAAGIVLAAGFGRPALAQQQAAQNPLVVTAVNRTAAEEASRGAARADEAARPGDVLRYHLAFTNPTPNRVRGVKLDNPIPAGLHFVAGSATSSRDDVRAEFSADSGRTFSARPTETVTVDGEAVTRPVPADRYTHVRWVLAGWVQPGATVTAAYDAQLTALASAAAPK
jgi:uncharacterized repeat protein (TIGR01451 family)